MPPNFPLSDYHYHRLRLDILPSTYFSFYAAFLGSDEFLAGKKTKPSPVIVLYGVPFLNSVVLVQVCLLVNQRILVLVDAAL